MRQKMQGVHGGADSSVLGGGGGIWEGWGVQVGRFGGYMPVHRRLPSPCPPSDHTTMLIRLNKIAQILIMAAFVTSFSSILDPNNNSDPSLGMLLGRFWAKKG